MQAELRHIVMLLDYAPTRIPPDTTKEVLKGFDVYRFTNITIIFLPANTTSIVQPLAQGVIAAFKAHYRSQLVRFVIRTLDNNPDMTLQQVKIDAYSAGGGCGMLRRHSPKRQSVTAGGRLASWGRTRCQRRHPVRSDAAMHVQAVRSRQRHRQS
jgi:hypothetical protein